MDRRQFLQRGAGAVAAAAFTARDTAVGAQQGPDAASQAPPRITGSFFDLIHVNWFDAAYWTDTCLHWTEASWRALIRDMHEIGIDTIICGSTAFWGRPLFPGYEKTVGRPVRFGCKDPLRACSDEAKQLGMKVFYGIGFRGRVSQVRDYTRMEPPWPDVWFRWNTALAEAILDQYGAWPSFGGLYIAYEIDFQDHQVELYDKLIHAHLRPVIGKAPLLASPGFLGEVDDGAKLAAKVQRMGIDILAPQDYGGRSNSMDEVMKMVRAHARGLGLVKQPLEKIGVKLWSNCELFSFEPSPDGRAMCIGGPIDRVRQQIAIEAPLVEKLICYQYQGIMNRRTERVDIGHPSADTLYKAYREYLAGR